MRSEYKIEESFLKYENINSGISVDPQGKICYQAEDIPRVKYEQPEDYVLELSKEIHRQLGAEERYSRRPIESLDARLREIDKLNKDNEKRFEKLHVALIEKEKKIDKIVEHYTQINSDTRNRIASMNRDMVYHFFQSSKLEYFLGLTEEEEGIANLDSKLASIDDSNKETAKFDRLSQQWYNETGHYSVKSRAFLHTAYLQIIGMGKKAIPYLLEEIKKEKLFWFLALESITGVNPATDAESVDEMSQIWIQWGIQNHYIGE